MDTLIIMQIAQHLTTSVITAITKGISLPYAEGPEPIDAKLTHHVDLVPAADPQVNHKAKQQKAQQITEQRQTAPEN